MFRGLAVIAVIFLSGCCYDEDGNVVGTAFVTKVGDNRPRHQPILSRTGWKHYWGTSQEKADIEAQWKSEADNYYDKSYPPMIYGVPVPDVDEIPEI